jgi:GNAT superfamily N-acetyltransferase
VNPDLKIRAATAADTPLIFSLIRALADYENLGHEVVATEGDLRDALFGARPAAEVRIAEWRGAPAGFALFFHNFSTFLGKRGLYLEDLFVLPEMRGKGIGKALLVHLAGVAQERGCGRFEWSVLDWNQPAIDFYKGLGAREMAAWRIYRTDGPNLAKLAALEPL